MTKLVQASTSLFVVRHVGTARLDSLDSTRSTKSNVSSHDESSRDEPSGIWAYGEIGHCIMIFSFLNSDTRTVFNVVLTSI